MERGVPSYQWRGRSFRLWRIMTIGWGGDGRREVRSCCRGVEFDGIILNHLHLLNVYFWQILLKLSICLEHKLNVFSTKIRFKIFVNPLKGFFVSIISCTFLVFVPIYVVYCSPVSLDDLYLSSKLLFSYVWLPLHAKDILMFFFLVALHTHISPPPASGRWWTWKKSRHQTNP